MVRLFALEAETGEHLPDTRPEFAQLDKAQPDGKVDPRPAQQIQQDVVPKKIFDQFDNICSLFHLTFSFDVVVQISGPA